MAPGALRWTASLALVIGVAALAGCGRHGKAAPKGGTEVPPSQTKLKRNVDLTRVRQDSIEVFVETVGYLEAEGMTPICAGVPGLIDDIYCREGQWVDRGTLLAKVDQRRYEANAEVARANEKRAVAALALARDLAERAQSARIGVSEEERSKAVLGLRVAEAELESSKAARQVAERNLALSSVRAPYAGQINQRFVAAGAYVEDKTPLATIADESRIRLVGSIPEKATPITRDLMSKEDRLRATTLFGCGLAGPWSALAAADMESRGRFPCRYNLRFRLGPYPNREFHARIFYLSRVANPDTHMFECKAELDPCELDVEMKPGYTARIICPLRTTPEALVVPEESVRASERGFIAFVPELHNGRDGKPEWVARARNVDLGYRAAGKGTVEVLKGVRAGEWIVRRGAEALEDGTPIAPPEEQIRQMQTEPASAASANGKQAARESN
jgi:multidrug efflux system membrane fusion protein